MTERSEDDERGTAGPGSTARPEATSGPEPSADANADADVDERDEDDAEPSLAGIFGARTEEAPSRPALEPESPSLENAAFVALGVLFGLFVVYRAVAVLPA